MMQFIWVYVDDMVGKGAGFGLVLEIILYNSISLIPWALPIAILISSVMVMGNLGERYELASLKSAGVSLIRVILPLLYFAIGITIFSFICSNNLVPIANLKFKSRLHDIRTQKPTLNLEEGVFNEDFKGFIIHIGKKEDDNKSIKDVIIYDHQSYNLGKYSMITAKEGEMYMADENNYFVMNLRNGYHYQEGDKAKPGEDEKHSFMRTKFEEWTKVFDTKEFDIDMTEEERFKNHYTMLSVRQLGNAIDSIDNRMDSYRTRLDELIQNNFFPLKEDLRLRKKAIMAEKEEERKKRAEAKRKEKKEKIKKRKQEEKDSNQPPKNRTVSKKTKAEIDKSKKVSADKARKEREKLIKKDTKKKKSKKPKKKKPKKKTTTKRKTTSSDKKKTKPAKRVPMKPILDQVIDKKLTEYATFFHLFPVAERSRFNIKERAKTTAKQTLNHAQANQRSIGPKEESKVKHIFALYSKYTFALVCCVFLFIGAPMGAIVRKGGFGYPLLIAIMFFMFFIILNILFQKLAESFVLPARFAVWCPLLVLIPISILLTKRALEDKKVIDLGKYTDYFRWMLRILKGFAGT